MRPFPDCAIARFVLCCSERVAPVVLSRQQNAILRRGVVNDILPPAGTNLLEDMDRSVSSGTGCVWGAGELCATVCDVSCRRSMVTAAKKIKTAAAARPKPNDHQLCVASLKRHQLDVASAAAVVLSSRASPTRSKRTGDGCAGRIFLSSFSSSEKSFIAVVKFSSDWSKHTGTAMLPCSAKFPARRRFR